MAELPARDGAPRRKRRRQTSGDLFDTTDEFCRKAGISRATLWRMMRDGRLRFARFGRARRIPISEYERLTTTP
jgi:excisionase family DNA binding protein